MRRREEGRDGGQRRQGFTLLEVALAVTVVALGMMAMFGLMSGGLDNSAKAVADTQAAFLAENAFNALRERNVEEARKGPAAWDSFWTGLTNGTIALTIAAPPGWKGYSSSWVASTAKWLTYRPLDLRCLYVKPGGPYDLHLNKYVNAPLRAGVPTMDIVNCSLRYKLSCKKDKSGTRREVTLSVWEGEWGDIKKTDPLVFYSEFTNPGDL